VYLVYCNAENVISAPPAGMSVSVVHEKVRIMTCFMVEMIIPDIPVHETSSRIWFGQPQKSSATH